MQSNLRPGDRVLAKRDITTVFADDTVEVDARIGEAGTVIQVYESTPMVTVKWPTCVSDAHPDELERMQ